MVREIETIALFKDHGKKQRVALKYHLGISKMLVFLGSVAKLLVKIVNFAVVFFFPPQVTYISSLQSELRGTVLGTEL